MSKAAWTATLSCVVACAVAPSRSSPPRSLPAVVASAPEPAPVEVAAPRVVRSLSPQSGHVSQVWAVAFSPDGKLIATGGFDHTIGIWSLDGRRWATLLGHREALRSVAWSSDGRELLSSARDGRVIIWDLALSRPRLVIEHRAFKVASSPDQTTIATAGPDTTLRLWSARDGRLLDELPTANGAGRQLLSVAYSPNGTELLAGSLDGHVQVWDAIRRQPLASAKVGTMVWNVAFSRDSARYAVASSSGIDLFERLSPVSVRSLTVAGTTLSHVAFASDGQLVSSGGGQLFVLDLATGKVKSRIRAGVVEALALSPDSSLAVTGGDDAQVRVWGLHDGLPRAALGVPRAGAHVATFSPDAAHVVTGGDGGVSIWDAERGGVLGRLGETKSELDAPRISPDGKLVVAVDRDSARVWELSSRRELLVAPAPVRTGDPPHVAVSPDSRQLAVSSGGKLAVWSLDRRRLDRRVDIDKGGSAPPHFSADGRWLVLCSRSGVVVLDAKTAKRQWVLDPKQIVTWGSAEACRISPDGTKLVVATSQQLGLFDLASGKLESTITGRGLHAAPTFSPDGRFVAYATQQHAVALWDTRSSSPALTLTGPELAVRVIRFSPRGGSIAAGSDEGSVWVWDVASRRLVARFGDHEARVWSLEWHPTAEVLLSASHFARLLRVRDGASLTLRPLPSGVAGITHAESGAWVGDALASVVLSLREGADLSSSRLEPLPGDWHAPALLARFWANEAIPSQIPAALDP